MSVKDVSEEAVGVGETLWSGTLPYTDHTVLFRVQYSAL